MKKKSYRSQRRGAAKAGTANLASVASRVAVGDAVGPLGQDGASAATLIDASAPLHEAGKVVSKSVAVDPAEVETPDPYAVREILSVQAQRVLAENEALQKLILNTLTELKAQEEALSSGLAALDRPPNADGEQLAQAETQSDGSLTKPAETDERLKTVQAYADLLAEQVRLEEAEILRLDAERQALKAQIQTHLDDKARLQQAAGKALEERQALDARIQVLEKQVADLEKQVADNAAALLKAEAQTSAMLEKLTVAEGSLAKAKTYAELLKEQVHLDGVEIRRLASYEAKVGDYETELKSAADEIKRLRLAYTLGEISREPVLGHGLGETVIYPALDTATAKMMN